MQPYSAVAHFTLCRAADRIDDFGELLKGGLLAVP